MLKQSSWIILSSLVLGAGFAGAQGPGKPIHENTFKDDVGSWISIGPNAKIVVYHDPALGAPTTGALRFNYGVNKGEFNALLLPAASGLLKSAKSIKFFARSDHATGLVVAIQEEEGGRYMAIANVPKDEWQKVELSIGDFALAMDKNDPKDPNGKLDLDLVSGMLIGDLSQMFAQSEDAAVKNLISVKTGPHTLYLDDFTVGADAIAPSTSSVGDDVRIDSFSHPQLAWIGLGGIKLSRVAEKPLDRPGLKAEYRQAPGKPIILSRSMMPWVLTQAKSISFDAASLHPAKLIVQVEETTGGKYNAIVDVPAGSEARPFDLPFSSFKLSEDSKDPDGKLDLGKVKLLSFIDATAFTDSANRDNILWLTNILGVARK